jgi:hypothetical protein
LLSGHELQHLVVEAAESLGQHCLELFDRALLLLSLVNANIKTSEIMSFQELPHRILLA